MVILELIHAIKPRLSGRGAFIRPRLTGFSDSLSW